MMNDAPMHSDEPMARSKPLVLSENPSEEEEEEEEEEEYDPRKCGSSIKAYAEEEEEAAEEAARPIASALVIDVSLFARRARRDSCFGEYIYGRTSLLRYK